MALKGCIGDCGCHFTNDPLGTILVEGDNPISISAPNMPYIRPAVMASRTTAQSIPFNTLTPISFTVENFDTDTMFAPTATFITIRTKGIYLVGGNVQWQGNNANGGVTWHEIYIDRGSGFLERSGYPLGTSLNPVKQAVEGLFLCNVGDTFGITVRQGASSGTDSVNIDPTLVGTPFSSSPTPGAVNIWALRMGDY